MAWIVAFYLSVAAFGAFFLVRALRTGRALGRYGLVSRASTPVRFWLNVAALVGLTLISGMQLLSVAVSHAMPGRAFRAVHAISDTSDLPASPVARLSTPGCAGPGPRVCLGSIGAAPDVSLDTLARYYRSLLGSAVGLLDPIAVTREVQGVPIVDAARSQLGAHALMNLLRETYPTLWQDPDVTVVVLTGNDLWFEDRPDLHYGFGTATSRQRGGGFAIVSTARMDPAAYGRATDAALLERRVRAMVGKYLAVLRYGEAPSSDPASPVYNAIQAPTDLDRMRAFQPPRQ